MDKIEKQIIWNFILGKQAMLKTMFNHAFTVDEGSQKVLFGSIKRSRRELLEFREVSILCKKAMSIKGIDHSNATYRSDLEMEVMDLLESIYIDKQFNIIFLEDTYKEKLIEILGEVSSVIINNKGTAFEASKRMLNIRDYIEERLNKMEEDNETGNT